MATGLESVTYEFLIILAAALFATIASQKLKLPAVVALIFAGVVIGPNALGLVQENEVVTLFAEVGAALLLFYVGIEFDFSKLLKVGVKAASFALVKITIIFIAVYEAALLLGLNTLTAAIVAFMLSITSTTILLRILKDRGLGNRPEVRLLVAELIVEDILVIIGIAAISSMNTPGFTLAKAFTSFLVGMAYLGIAYFVVRWLAEKTLHHINTKDAGTMLFLSLTLCLALSVLAVVVGLSAAIGAFLAGSIIASLKAGHEAKKATEPLGLAFAAIFFISIGMLSNPSLIMAGLAAFTVLIAVQMLASYLGTYTATRAIGFTPAQAGFSAASFLVLGEFSLLLAREAAPITSIDVVGLASLGVLVTAALTPAALSRHDKLLNTLANTVPRALSSRFNNSFNYTATVIKRLEFGGPVHALLKTELAKRKEDLKKVVIVDAAVLAATLVLTGISLKLFDRTLSLPLIGGVILLLTLVYLTAKLALSAFRVFHALQRTLGATQDATPTATAIAAMASALLALLVPTATEALRLPGLFNAAQIPLFAIAAALAWNTLRCFGKHKKNC
ncbi:hypothetical protein AUJ14_03585 [Candidatus Micrarchaeota archaeon CG1_02_55_22]|nr:MAG: hypothetical protein AUJ14_03585 [Candidatus Micrarchaeota archaeon CG1_02_55_22]